MHVLGLRLSAVVPLVSLPAFRPNLLVRFVTSAASLAFVATTALLLVVRAAIVAMSCSSTNFSVVASAARLYDSSSRSSLLTRSSIAVLCGVPAWRSAPWAALSPVSSRRTRSFMSAVLYAVFHAYHVCVDASRSYHLFVVHGWAPVFNIAFVTMRSRVASIIGLLPVPRFDFLCAASSALMYSRIPSLSVW